jgi:hypothetical protein
MIDSRGSRETEEMKKARERQLIARAEKEELELAGTKKAILYHNLQKNALRPFCAMPSGSRAGQAPDGSLCAIRPGQYGFPRRVGRLCFRRQALGFFPCHYAGTFCFTLN